MSFRFCPRCATELSAGPDAEGTHRATCPACSFVHYDNPTPVVAAIVEHDGDVILVRNRSWPAAWFGLVTGFLERAEHPDDAVLREVREELGLDGRIAGFVGHYDFEQMNQIIIAYHVVATGEIVVGDELEAIKRVPVDRLRPWPIGTGRAVADWLDARSR